MITARIQRSAFQMLPLPLLLTLALAQNTSVAQQPKQPIPVVTSASVPVYPQVPLLAQITGAVRLRLSTDGSHVTLMDIESGPAILANAAEENVRTWQFEPHKATTFEATFTYTLLPATCDAAGHCNARENDEVLLHLPTDVQIRTRAVVLN